MVDGRRRAGAAVVSVNGDVIWVARLPDGTSAQCAELIVLRTVTTLSRLLTFMGPSIKRGLLTSGGHNAASPTGNNTLSGPPEGSFSSGSRKQTGGRCSSGRSFGGGPDRDFSN